jgi:membrane associated rhomboid family serine protease
MTIEIGILICSAIITVAVAIVLICFLIILINVNMLCKKVENVMCSARRSIDNAGNLSGLIGSIFNFFRANKGRK